MSGASDEKLMRLALQEAAGQHTGGPQKDDVPVGALAARWDGRENGIILARARNRREAENDPTAHAEMLVLRAAARRAGHWRLSHVTLVVTLEPCAMCAGAILAAQVPRVVFGAFNPEAGAVGSRLDLLRDRVLGSQVEVSGGVLAAECGALLSEFFQRQRKKANRTGEHERKQQ